jgi:anti-sigma regulatory factor (Ser/Thr protein kinase)
VEELSLHILDVAENSLRAGASLIEISIVEDPKQDMLTIEIQDNGKGMDEETVKRATDPFFTTQKTRQVGLGLPLLAAAARESDGTMAIHSEPEKGTRIKASFKYSHIDRKPLGNVDETLIGLIVCNPQADFRFCHRKGTREYRTDTVELKRQFGITMIDPTLAFKIIADYAEFMKEERDV